MIDLETSLDNIYRLGLPTPKKEKKSQNLYNKPCQN